MNRSLSQSVQKRIEAYLDSVEKQLRSTNLPRHRRLAVVEDLAAQIGEALSRLIREPTAADAAAVIERLDPPSAFAASDVATDAKVRVQSRQIRWPITMVAIVMTVGLSAIGRILQSLQSVPNGPAPAWSKVVTEIAGAAIVPAVIVGTIAWFIERTIRQATRSKESV